MQAVNTEQDQEMHLHSRQYLAISENTGDCFEAIPSPGQQQKTCPKYPPKNVRRVCLMPMHCVLEYFVLEELLNRINLGQFRPVPAREPVCKTPKLGRSCTSLVVTHHWYQIGIPWIFALCILFRSGEQHTRLG